MNKKPDKIIEKPASASGDPKTIGTKPIRTFSGPSLKGEKVGPKSAPYYERG